MAYNKTNWVNGQAPALSAENLNKIEEGVFNNDANISILQNGLISLDTSAASGTTDGDLYAAIVALGWENDVIV